VWYLTKVWLSWLWPPNAINFIKFVMEDDGGAGSGPALARGALALFGCPLALLAMLISASIVIGVAAVIVTTIVK